MSVFLILLGCSVFSSLDDYYDKWSPPDVSDVSPNSEAGNLGGQVVTISGSGFGDSADELVVLIGSRNAEILSVSDGSVTVTAPPGPLSGGATDITIATSTGYTILDGAYTYDVGEGYEEQVGYVSINNYWESCYGGGSQRLNDEYASYGDLGCGSFPYIGTTGLDARADALSFAWPRMHTELTGFYSATDFGAGEWKIERPGQIGFLFGVDDLHQDIGSIYLYNDYWDDTEFCPKIDKLNEGEVVEGRCTEEDNPYYAVSSLELCSYNDEYGVPTYSYAADWPVLYNFFDFNENRNTSAEIELDIPEAGIEDQTLLLPEPLIVYATEGIESPLEAGQPAEDVWSLGTLETCFDDDGDGEQLDDVALAFEWQPAMNEDEYSQGGNIIHARTFVRMTITQLPLAWFGAWTYPTRATITVDDRHGYTPGTGSSRLEVPAWVMYQFPTTVFPGSIGGQTRFDPSQGYVIIEIQRTTDYTLDNTNEALEKDEEPYEPIVFSYTTGDFGFYAWSNPMDDGNCEE